MRKCFIIAGLAVWLVLVLAGIFIVVNRTSVDSNGDVAVLMQSATETAEQSETEAVPCEPESTAEITNPSEGTAISKEPEATAYIPEESKIFAESEPEIPPERKNSPSVTEKESESEETYAPQKEMEEAPEQIGRKEEIPSSFTACNMTTDALGTFRYWLYTPSNPTENMPLIVYLHGGSGKGSDLNLITSVDGFPQYLQSGMLGDVRAYVVIPQLPSDQKGWAGVHDSLYNLIQHIVSGYSVDAGNISLTGHSMGGTGTWSLAAAYPTLFARIAPLSGSVRNTADMAAKLMDIPVRAFVGSADTIVPPESSEEVVSLLRESDADAKTTVFDGADHFTVPSLAYLNKGANLIGWLIGQNE